MGWEYDPADLSSSQTARVHFYLGDTVEADPLIQDEEIDFIILAWTPVYGENADLLFAAQAAESIAAKFAREVSYSADGVSIGTNELADKYRGLAAQLRQQNKENSVGGEPYVGGVNPYETPDPLIKPTSFAIGMHDNLAAGAQDMGAPGYVGIPEIDFGY